MSKYKRTHLVVSNLLLSAAAACLSITARPALADGFERGPAPTVESLQAAGPFAVGSYKISRSAATAFGYGGATVYFPQGAAAANQRFGIVTFTPGFTAVQADYAPLASKIASHGFVVVNLDTLTTFDQPGQRATEMAGAMRHTLSLINAGNVPFAAVSDVARRAVMGHSMGGGGTLIDASANDALKAAVALTPWSQQRKDFSADKVPTMIVACQQDTVATNSQHSDVFYASLSPTLPRAEVEVKGVGHLCATSYAAASYQATVVKSAVVWLKLYVDEDSRYLAMAKGQMNAGDYSRFSAEGF